MGKNTADVVSKLVESYAKRLGYELYDVEYVKEGADYYLRIYIDKEGGVISTDDCERMSREIDAALDEADPIENSYFLEVSSVGIDRPIKKQKDFERFMGSRVEVRLFAAENGKKELYGTLCGYDKDSFTLKTDGGETLSFNIKDASLIRPCVDFNE